MPIIKPVDEAGDSRQCSLNSKLSPALITKALGFPPNVKDDPAKVRHSWGFTVDGVRCGIWDYKGSRWSAFGPREVLASIFGWENVE